MVRSQLQYYSDSLWLAHRHLQTAPSNVLSVPAPRVSSDLGVADQGSLLLAHCRLAEGEKTNGRWAMVAVVGILGQELLGVHPAWYLHGEKVRCNFTHAPNCTRVQVVHRMFSV